MKNTFQKQTKRSRRSCSSTSFSRLLALFILGSWACTLLQAQQRDTQLKPATLNPFVLPEDSLDFKDKYIISELEKIQYANYSEGLKKQTLEKLLENQKLQNASLQQKLLNQQLKAQAERKQAEVERNEAQAKAQQERQKQKIRQLEIKELNQQLTLENRTRNFLLIGVSLLTLLGISLFWSNQQLKKRNRSIQKLSAENLLKEQEKQQILATQNETLEQQVKARTHELNESLTELKSTQAQLIQSEKLASLGELTAGIAHEIQNPLNFVNNFAEVSAELLDELKEELEKGDTAEVKAIAEDLQLNLGKINHHGQRASSIVKGMLEHSRQGRDAMHRVSTDLNALADEYLRLAYHGLRAKDSRDAMHGVFAMPKHGVFIMPKIETHFDPDLPLVSVIPQDMGRVLLNLINNAFYAVAERATTVETLHATSLHATSVHATDNETLHATSLQPPYQPTVTVSTQKMDDQIIIRVQDNGEGIPDGIRDKIFQPFFTTKPTGQGTGLGLSLAYDIVTKGHGGVLKVENAQEQGAIFTIRLPIA